MPPSVIAAYQSALGRANNAASLPFNQYSQQANSVAPDYTLGNAGTFVAPVNQQQAQGISGTNQYAETAQPYFGAATSQIQNAQAGTGAYNNAAAGTLGSAAQGTAQSASPLTAQQIQQYESPYLQTVLGSTANVLNQNNQQQQAGQLGNAINSGAFGGDRTGIAAANLEEQQNLANSQIYSGIANQAYQSALGTAQGEQQIGLQGAGQLANIGQAYGALGQTAYGEGANTANALAGFGSGAQAAGLQGAQAQIGAGTLEQQTQQAQDQALYNQFLQQQSFPYQQAQFYANIAEGTGALSGSTTTTQQPGGFFSDERLKHEKRPIGKTFDGQTIYSYKMHGDPRTHVGLMAQEVEEKHPEAVGLAAGYKTVDYGKATRKAANEGHFNAGGVVEFRKARALGGGSDLDTILAAQQQMYSGLGGGEPRAMTGAPRGGSARVPAATVPVGNLMTASGGLQARPTGAQNVAAVGRFYKDIGSPNLKPSGGWPWESTTTNTTPGGLANAQANPNAALPDNPQGVSQMSIDAPAGQYGNTNADQGLAPQDPNVSQQKRGGRIHRAMGGDMPYSDPGTLDIPDENPHNTLSKPAQLPPPSPTGFQQLMSLGSGLGGSGGMMSGMFGGSGGSGLGASSLFDSGSTAGDAYGAAAASSDATIAGDLAAAGGKRGGRMMRKHRDTGGWDADSAANSAGLGDAPDASVDQAPALKQGAPNTSLDSVKHLALAAGEAYIGDYPGAASQLYDTYQSASHKAGGRIKRDDGGGLGGDPDITPVSADTPDSGVMLPEQTVEAPNPGLAPVETTASKVPVPDTSAGLAQTPAAPAATSAREDSGTPLWDKVKGFLGDPHNLVPILAGVGAMGTAPTRSLGVALAAGIQGAAQNYVPTQEGLARAQGQNIQNQLMQTKLDMWRNPPSYPTDASTASPPINAPDPYGYRSKFNIPNAMNPQEESAYQIAGQRDAVLGTKFAPLIQQRAQNRIITDQNQAKMGAQAEADNLYQTAMTTTDPKVAQDAVARLTDVHQYTGDTYPEIAGVVRNSRTGQQPIGSTAQAAPPTVLAQLAAEGAKMIDVPTNVPGQTIQMPQFRRFGASDPMDYARKMYANSLAVPPALANQGYGTGTAAATPSAPSRPAATVAPPGNAVRPATPVTTASASAAATLPGLDIASLPRIHRPPVQAGVTASTEDVQNVGTLTGTRKKILDDATERQVLANQNNALLTPFMAKLNSVSPRDVGPGSPAYKGLMELKTAIDAKPPQDLVDMEVIDKFANQLGVQNVRSLIGTGQRITNQEMMNFLTRASASTTQPLDVMKQIVAYQKANNDFDILATNTKQAALSDPTMGINPWQANGIIDAKRAQFVQNDMAAILGQGKPDAHGFIPGKRYTDKQGNSAVYLGNGAWK